MSPMRIHQDQDGHSVHLTWTGVATIVIPIAAALIAAFVWFWNAGVEWQRIGSSIVELKTLAQNIRTEVHVANQRLEAEVQQNTNRNVQEDDRLRVLEIGQAEIKQALTGAGVLKGGNP